MNDYPEMMTVKQAARFLQCSERNIYNRLKRGTLPAIKIGKEWRLSKSEIIRMTREELEKKAAKKGGKA